MSALVKNTFATESITETTVIEEPVITVEAEDSFDELAMEEFNDDESNEYETAISDCLDIVGGLEEFSSAIEATIVDGGLTQQSLTVAVAGLNYIEQTSGLKLTANLPAMETITEDSRIPATEGIMDKIKAGAKTAWKAIIEFIKKIIAAAVIFFKSIDLSNITTKTAIDKIKTAYGNIKGDIGELLKTDITVNSNVCDALDIASGGKFDEATYSSQLEKYWDTLSTLVNANMISSFQASMLDTLTAMAHEKDPRKVKFPSIDVYISGYLKLIPSSKKFDRGSVISDELVMDEFHIEIKRTGDIDKGECPRWHIFSGPHYKGAGPTKNVTVKRCDKNLLITALAKSDTALSTVAKISVDMNKQFDQLASNNSKCDSLADAALPQHTQNIISMIASYNGLLNLHINIEKYLRSKINVKTKALYNFAVINYRGLRTEAPKEEETK